MRSVWLVRHASTAWTGVRWSGRSDPPLTEAGLAEARSLADALAALVDRPSLVVTSPSLRAVETARVVAERLGAAVERDPDLREVDLGGVDGLTFDEVAAAFPELAAAALAGSRDIDWPGGERAADLRERVGRAWARLAGHAADRTVVAVTHGGVIGELVRLVVPPDAVPAGWSAPASALQLVDAGTGWIVGAAAAAAEAGPK